MDSTYLRVSNYSPFDHNESFSCNADTQNAPGFDQSFSRRFAPEIIPDISSVLSFP
jgi:hypothetical protein